MSSRTLAVHLTSKRLVAVLAEVTMRGMQIQRVEDRPAPTDDAPPAWAADLAYDRVVATVGSDMALFRFLELPFGDRRRITQAVGPALEEHVPLSLDEAEVVWDWDGSSGGRRVLAAMARTATLDAHADRIAALFGRRPERMPWAPAATVAAYRAAATGSADSWSLVDVGADGALVATVESGRLAGLHLVAPCDDELLVRNVAWSLRALGPSGPTVVLGGARAAAIEEAAANALEDMAILPAPREHPLAGAPAARWSAVAPAIGALLIAGGRAERPALEFAAAAGGSSSAALGVLGELRPLASWGAAALALLTLAAGIDYARLASERAAVVAATDAAIQDVMPGTSGAGARLKLEMRARELADRAGSTAGGAVASPLEVLAELSRAVPRNLDIEILDLVHAPPAVRFSGKGADFEVVTKLEEALSASSIFSSVEIKDVQAAVSGSGVDFKVILQLAGAEGAA